LQRLDHDQELFREIVQIYVEDSSGMLRAIHDAVERADAGMLQRAAHSLKGLSATLSAQQVVSAAYRLEQMGATGNLTDAAAAVAAIDQQMNDLNQVVRSYLQG
jgi:HPt (histidine-containing phosphotransfer) domain-containing protein